MSDTQAVEPKPVKTVQVCEMKFERSNKRQYLYIKVVPELEKLLASPTVEQSAKYFDLKNNGLVYYTLAPKLQAMQDKFNHSGFRRNYNVDMTIYGSTFFTENGRVNFSLLRTKGISKGIKVRLDDLILEDETKGWMSELGYFLKFLYTNFVNRIDVRANITIEF